MGLAGDGAALPGIARLVATGQYPQWHFGLGGYAKIVRGMRRFGVARDDDPQGFESRS